MIAYADQFDGQYRDRATMIEAMIGKVTIAALERGWKGLHLAEFRWEEKQPNGEPWRDGLPMACIVVGPGHSEITVAACREFLRAASEQRTLL